MLRSPLLPPPGEPQRGSVPAHSAQAGELQVYGRAVKLRESGDSALFRAHRRADGRPVLIKVLVAPSPSAVRSARIRHEYSILRSIDAPGVAIPLGVERIGDALALVLRDSGQAASLDSLVAPQGLELRTFFGVALAIAGIVEAVHRSDIVHKDIKPHHFLCDADGSSPKLVDFGFATRLSLEDQRIATLSRLEGTLAYMSPEQTGRMNRLVDQRSDLYSLGVTLYQLVTGVLPFPSEDPLELVHSHIARAPIPPHVVAPTIPRVLSDAILKLLSKTAEDRYQDIAGLRADLRRMADGLDASNAIFSFPLAEHDVSRELRVPQRLYGRKAETDALFRVFEEVCAGSAEFLLISGYSGIGKSVLVRELYRQLTRGGHFVVGKFDQLGRRVPYAPISRALADLIRSILAEPPATLARWRDRILEAVGANGQVVMDLVPELELVIGLQPMVQELGPGESQHRFEMVFDDFLRVFTTAGHPLVLFLDDLQWADSASLRLMHVILTGPRRGHLLVIGAYRDNEVDPLHPLTLALSELRKTGGTIRELKLGPLGFSDVADLLADTFGGARASVLPLAEMAWRKTHGNPFFLTQFLAMLQKQGWLTFDAGARSWTWDLERIEAAMVTDNVVELMVAKLRGLPRGPQHLLRLAACVGHQFDRKTLALISEQSSRAVANELWDALREGVVVPLEGGQAYLHDRSCDDRADGDADSPDDAFNPTYRFLHDRVQQAAYALIDEDRKREVHLRIGRLLMSGQGDGRDQGLFDVVNHMNLGADLIVEPEERRSLARMNLAAGRRARDAAAHSVAAKLLGTCIDLLGESAWEVDYDIAFPAHLARAECEYVGKRIDEAFRLLDVAGRLARTPLDRAAVFELRTVILTNLNRVDEGTACAIEAARQLGMAFPDSDADRSVAIGAEFASLAARMSERTIESLVELPAMTDPEKLALVNVLNKSIPSAAQCSPQLMFLMVARAVNLALEFGNAPVSSFFYLCLGWNHSIRGDFDTAYRLGQLGLRLNERVNTHSVDGANHFIFATFIAGWTQPLSESLEYHRRGLKVGLAGGDFLHAGYCASHRAVYRFFLGDSLEAVLADIQEYVEILRRTDDVINLKEVELVRRLIANLQGRTTSATTLEGDGFDSAAFEREMMVAHNIHHISSYYLFRAIARFFAGEYAFALDDLERAAPALIPGNFLNAEHCLYRALSLAGRLHALDGRADGSVEPLLGELRALEATLRRWAQTGPASFGHRHALVAAELAAIAANTGEALDLYDRAVSLARKHGCLAHEALAHELCAAFLVRRGKTKFARVCAADAHDAYQRWGATAKARELASHLAPIGFTGSVSQAGEKWLTAASAPGVVPETGVLDLRSIVKATHAISSEVKADRLFAKLMAILIENAGAQQGALVLRSSTTGELRIEAVARIDQESRERRASRRPLPIEESQDLCADVVRYVARSSETVVLDDARLDERYRRDPYLSQNAVKSLLCMPVLAQGQLVAIFYAENNATTHAFTRERIELLQMLAAQAAISIANAGLYANLEDRVAERTSELTAMNQEVAAILDSMRQGIFTFDDNLRIKPQYSVHLEHILGERRLAGRDCLDVLFRGSDVGDVTLSTMRTALQFGFGVDIDIAAINWTHLVKDFARRRDADPVQYLEVDWNPITSEAGQVQKMLVTVRDVTEVRHLHAEAARNARELEVLGQVLDCGPSAFDGFSGSARQMMSDVAAIFGGGAPLGRAHAELALRNMHTVKGNASMLGLTDLAEILHLAETACAPLRADPEGFTDLAAQATWVKAVLARLHEYDAVRRDKLGELATDRRLTGVVDRIGDVVQQARTGSFTSSRAVELIDSALARVHAVPLRELVREIGRMLPSLARQLEKDAPVLAYVGIDIDVAPSWTQVLRDSLVHVLRNAMDHGIEPPEERRAAGKPTRGRIEFRVERTGGLLKVHISDDGRGLDLDTLREKTGDHGASDEELAAKVFLSGVSTTAHVSRVSGRGVGLDAVHAFVRGRGGDARLVFTGSRAYGRRPFALVLVLPEDATLPDAAHAPAAHCA